jgi:hypothetical protein
MDEIVRLMTVGSFFMLLIALFLIAGVFYVYIMRMPKGKRSTVISSPLFSIIIILIAISAFFIYGMLENSFSQKLFRILSVILLGSLEVLSLLAVFSDVEHLAEMHTAHRFKRGTLISQLIFLLVLFITISLMGISLFFDTFSVDFMMMLSVWLLSFYIYSLYPKFFIHLEEEYGKIFIVRKAKRGITNGKKRK